MTDVYGKELYRMREKLKGNLIELCRIIVTEKKIMKNNSIKMTQLRRVRNYVHAQIVIVTLSHESGFERNLISVYVHT